MTHRTSRAGFPRRSVVAALFTALLMAAILPAAAIPGKAKVLESRMRGAEALRAVQARLGSVAAINRVDQEKLTDALSKDRSTGLDRAGRLFFVEDAMPGAAAAGDEISAGAPALAVDNPFALHSNPGSNRVIYLDFDGAELTDTVWNDEYADSPSVAMPGYSLDQLPEFSPAELDSIIEIWLRIAEDYAPFDVDVTTEQPSDAALTRTDLTDQIYGTEVLITTDTMKICGCGGWSYYNAFDEITSPERYYQPALVFYENLGDGYARYVAEAASHEAGHNLGLFHDGTLDTAYYRGHGSGSTGWAPIMGSAYDRELTQWSRGEYPRANNPEDDLAVIASHGVSPRADDAGDIQTDASPLAATSSTGQAVVDHGGTIEGASDVDWLSFSTAGAISLQIAPAPVGPNLDVRASLYKSDGSLAPIADNPSNDPLGLSANLAGNVAPGKYFVKIEGVGDTNPLPGYSDYASLGRYTVKGTIAMGTVPGPPTDVRAIDVIDSDATPEASVSFVPPSDDGGNAITSYVVTSSPGGYTASGPSSPITVPLALGSTYTFTVRAVNALGTGPASVPSNPVSPTSPATGVSVTDSSGLERNSLTRVYKLNVTRAGPTSSVATVRYSTANGTATAGSDYVAVSSATLKFRRGESVKQINVTVKGDRTIEPNETFFVNLSSPVGATIGRASATFTILNDD